MAATTSIGGGGTEDRVLATAQKIVQSLNAPKEVREDMILILSGFDNRLSNISSLIGGDESKNTPDSRFDAAEKTILRWESSAAGAYGHSLLWDEEPYDEANEYLEAVDEVLELIDDPNIKSNSEIMDRAESSIQIAMSRLEDEFRHILIRNTVQLDAESLYWSIKKVSLSFPLNGGEIYENLNSFAEGDNGIVGFHERGVSLCDDVSIELINPDAVIELKEIAERMIRSGYEKELHQVYTSVRRDALDDCLAILGVEKLSIEDVQKIDSVSLDDKMKKWLRAIKITVRVLLTGEKRLSDQIFNDGDLSFNETAKWCIVQLLNFAEAVAIVNISSEKLFRVLDMYEALSNLIPNLEEMVTDDFTISEAQVVLTGLGEAATRTLGDFEDAVKSEASRKPMTGGEIHPLTRYVMNYVKLLVDYSDTLNSLLDDNLGCRLSTLLSHLESNLEEKSKLYEDGGMRYIFLMNNVLYIVQKVKGSDLGELLGDLWVRKHRGLIRRYATSYLRASWSKVLSCLKDEGIGGIGSSGKASNPALKERFKNFNACFEELYRVQTGWKVPDPQLREELRISISEQALPAYRSFVGRFGPQLLSTRHGGRYVKYSPEDLENYLLDLFEGSGGVLPYTRRKAT